MSELLIPKIEKNDIKVPHLEAGSSAIVFQRHERYQRDNDAENAGSIVETDETKARDEAFFKDLLAQDVDGAETMVLFVSSDTQYADKGYRSMETAQLAQDAAIKAMEELDIKPSERIINLSPDFNMHGFEATGQSIRPDKKIREPQIFDDLTYVRHLQEKYNDDGGPSSEAIGAHVILSPAAWGAHEMDAEKEKREELGAEGVHDMVDRTKRSMAILERYAKSFHANHPGKKLVIWSASHYDTISPLVKDATDTGFDHYVPVDYGGGVVIELKPDSEPTLEAQGHKVKLDLGSQALETAETSS
jgi:hypothetical protein